MDQEEKSGDCYCAHDHSHNEGDCCEHHENSEMTISHEEADILFKLVRHNYLPVCQFVMGISTEEEMKVVALSPVLISHTNDDINTVRGRGKILLALEQKGLIALDYDIPLGSYDYGDYKKSPAFTYFMEMINEGKSKEGFLFDTAELETGSIALTDLGKMIVGEIQQQR